MADCVPLPLETILAGVAVCISGLTWLALAWFDASDLSRNQRAARNLIRAVRASLIAIVITGFLYSSHIFFLLYYGDSIGRAVCFLRIGVFIVLALSFVLWFWTAATVLYALLPGPLAILRDIKYQRPRVNTWKHSEAAADSLVSLKIAHGSDLHLTSDTTLEHGHDRASLSHAAAEALGWMAQRAHFIALTGDITDQGRDSDYDQFHSILTTSPSLLESGRLLVIPGNHDLSLTTSIHLVDATRDVEAEKRSLAFVRRILANCPTKWSMLTSSGFKSVRKHLEEVRNYLDICQTYPPYTKSMHPQGGLGLWLSEEASRFLKQTPDPFWPNSRNWSCTKFLELAYPMVMVETDDYLIVGLNSCVTPAHSILGSGAGDLGQEQISRLRTIIKNLKNRTLVLLIHHHVGLPEEIYRSIRDRSMPTQMRLLKLREWRQLSSMLSEIDRCIVLHGHTHVVSRGKVGKATVLGASATYLFGREQHFSCAVYSIGEGGLVSIVEDS